MKKILLCAIPMFFLMWASTSCYTQKKASKQVNRAQTTYPIVVAKGCASWYAPKSSTSTITKIVQGQNTIDTLWLTDTLKNTITKERIIFKTIVKSRVDTFYSKTTDTLVNTADVVACNLENDALTKSGIEKDTKIALQDKRLTIFYWGLGILLGIGAVWLLVKFKR